jgi:hypothetical protein
VKTIKQYIRPLYRKCLQRFVESALEPALRYSENALDSRERMLYLAFRFLEHNKIEGDYMEFGVFRGHIFTHSFHLARRYFPDMHLHAFDSFEGLPEITGRDKDELCEFQEEEYACTLEEFKTILNKHEVDLNKVTLVPGWYDKVLTTKLKERLPLTSASLVWIDCDLYESTVPVLEFITDYLVNGAIVVFDDWFSYRGHPEHGEQKAFTEWLTAHPSLTAVPFQKFWWLGNSFIIHRK